MESTMKLKRLIARRTFLKGSAVALATASTATIIPSSALGKDGATVPSDRIVLGGIGVGRRGRYVLGRMLAEKGLQFVAACDVQASRRQYVKDMVDGKHRNKDCAMYRDMFELLGRKDIDSVLVTTGDNWHALASILAAKAGKDVYCEKPCGMMLGDCQDLADTMNRYSRVFQAGTQRRSIGNFQFAVHLARSGKLGKLHTLHASIGRLRVSHAWLAGQPEPDKNVVDWNRWLGPAPWRPYNKRYVQGQWHGYADLNAGASLLDWGSHTVDLCQWANDADETTPITYEPDGGTINARYANGVKLVIRPDKWLGVGTCPVRFEGDEGWIETGDTGRIVLHPASLMGERKRYLRKGTDPAGHVSNFFDCMRSRGLTAANADVMRQSHLACHAAAIAWRLGRKVTFDPATETFVNDEQANRMCRRAKRAPWHA